MLTDKKQLLPTKTAFFVVLALPLLVGPILMPYSKAFAAACSLPSTDYGTATSTISVPGAATYRVWTRMHVPNNTNKTYLLEIDGTSCFTVGGGTIAPTTWAWVDHHSGNDNSKVQLSLSQGNHTIKLIGNAPGIKIDRVIAASDLSCIPTGFGDSCNVPDDTESPSVAISSPPENVQLSGTTTIKAVVTDNTGIQKVEFYDNSSLIGTATTSPYEVAWDTQVVQNGTHLITARAYDTAGNMSSDSTTVSIVNGDTVAPARPENAQLIATSYNSVKISWAASADNVGVVGYEIIRDGVPIKSLGVVTEYTDDSLMANTYYEYKVVAKDGAGNSSSASAPVSVTTPTVQDDQPPSQPNNVTSNVVSSNQVNLTWNPSSDDTGAATYDVYRSTGNEEPVKIGTTNSTSFGDSTAEPNTEYKYSIVARDGAGNTGETSTTIELKTPSSTKRISLTGKMADTATNTSVAFARVKVVVGSNNHIYQADRHGRYAAYNLMSGKYNFTFSARGYSSQTVLVNLSDSTTQNVQLKKR